MVYCKGTRIQHSLYHITDLQLGDDAQQGTM